MNRRQEPWYRNPFRLGGGGLVALLGGYAVLRSHVADGETSPLTVLGRLAFLAGALVVLAAGVIWFLDARAPEPAPDEEDHDEEASDEVE